MAGSGNAKSDKLDIIVAAQRPALGRFLVLSWSFGAAPWPMAELAQWRLIRSDQAALKLKHGEL